jgi:hypothetical protein
MVRDNIDGLDVYRLRFLHHGLLFNLRMPPAQ